MLDAYLQLDGIKGESTETNHTGWIELTSFNHGITQPTSTTKSSSGGATSGTSEHGDIFVSKLTDLSTPKLLEAVSTGKAISKGMIEFYRQSGDSKVKYLAISLGQLIISQVHANATTAGSDALPTETVGLNYGTIEWTYTQQKRTDGSGGGNSSGKYDLTKQKA